jgi:uncharacterized protein YceK
MKKIILILLVGLLSSCANVVKVESGEFKVSEHMSLTLTGAWNQLKAPSLKPAIVWSMEGVTVDQLLIYSDIKEGDTLVPNGLFDSEKNKKFIFHSTMDFSQIASLFEAKFTADGSIFNLDKIEPKVISKQKGVKLEFSVIRKTDNVKMQGLAYCVVFNNQLYALIYQAPKLTFFKRYQEDVEKMASTIIVR